MKHFLAKHATIKHRLYSLYYTLFSYGRGLIILTFCLWLGNIISKIIPIMIPGSIIGLLLLFFLLAFQLIPTCWIKNSCNLFMRYMTILFIPAAMGIMDNYSLLLENWIPIIFSSVGGSIIVLIFTALLTENFPKMTLKSKKILSKDQEKQP
ncbi:CidA/LrgA family protein [Gilliamella sp. B2776]|uniref:CidA/LrgA family protein n=1 Tax=unclassified Gilliamella TaxID=2685620 RepID=UPI00226AADE3|nr:MULTISPECIES: CidA/LrgA family protein [unclassified Gilliamella]MCX8650757.1 CidA/LrgA family protein [Gilliamella sp. B2779]MCX8654083.1 CidA/LrgA family protein [Gilliamella sp. B2737]MCX8657176.1 CidA/LrgA family protein [Gilliamella sp. B2894]MCX8665686.1 CidA/LrgA family protein [Gilliamella sp. B2887]MCX8692605.1 CidA/LrgA family protein [Gilliamella sp. B2776]